jgi:hypothetical protein
MTVDCQASATSTRQPNQPRDMSIRCQCCYPCATRNWLRDRVSVSDYIRVFISLFWQIPIWVLTECRGDYRNQDWAQCKRQHIRKFETLRFSLALLLTGKYVSLTSKQHTSDATWNNIYVAARGFYWLVCGTSYSLHGLKLETIWVRRKDSEFMFRSAQNESLLFISESGSPIVWVDDAKAAQLWSRNKNQTICFITI